jgi:TetR/AcrR family transcriptional regulator, transcriptional repressor for nem operon
MPTEFSPKAAEIAARTRALLAAGGYNSFSYADISAQVHISKASIHHHFPSKAELVRIVVAQYREEARQGLAALDTQLADPLAALQAYVDYWSACIRDSSNPFCICAMLAAELPTIPAEVAEEVRGHFQDLSAWLAALFKKGKARGQLQLHGSAAAEAKGFMATVHGAMLAARAFGDPQAFQAIVHTALARLTAA